MPTGARRPPHGPTLHLAAVLRAEIARKGWTAKETAAAAGMANSTLGNILRADRTPTVDQLFDVAAVLGVSAADLVDEATKMDRAEQGRERRRTQSLPKAAK